MSERNSERSLIDQCQIQFVAMRKERDEALEQLSQAKIIAENLSQAMMGLQPKGAYVCFGEVGDFDACYQGHTKWCQRALDALQEWNDFKSKEIKE